MSFSPLFFCATIDWVMGRLEGDLGINIGMTSFNDLDYADDAAFLASDPTRWNSVLERFREEAATVGLRPSWGKTKVCNLGLGGPPMNLNIHGEVVESVDSLSTWVVKSIRAATAPQISKDV